MASSDNIWNTEPMAPAEMTLRIRQIEYWIETVEMRDPKIRSGLICGNVMLHGDAQLLRECPPNLPLPHWTWQPAISWGRNVLYLHPENRPR